MTFFFLHIFTVLDRCGMCDTIHVCRISVGLDAQLSFRC